MRYDGEEIVIEVKTEDGWEEKRFVPKIKRVQMLKRRTILSNDCGTILVCHARSSTAGA